ncbi:RHS repeat-associated core domain-containing protein [Actinoplanes sp. NPDC051861]|uniref:RHS repeat domain-containing protein n=1 Tax=Actinoplanes sp. NPDC051861 TaxID=3155170 RepID=UPI0034138310
MYFESGFGRRLLAAAGAATLAVTLLTTPPAQAGPRNPSTPLKAQSEKLDSHGGEVRGRGTVLPAPKPSDLPEPVWPKSGTARVTLPGGGTAAVEVLDRRRLPEVWRDGVVARVPEAEGSSGKARVAIDYSGFRYAYGADWSSRLRMWNLPECALTTPEADACAATPLPARNDPAAGVMTAETSVATAGLVALAAGASGPSGDFTATSLAPSSTWSHGGSSGSFNWSYPMRVPPGIAGPQPKVELSYSSASVDGRSSATNNQPSWIGEGFEFSPGYIERRYVPCADDKAGSPNNPEQTGDLCWRSDNATMSLNGGGGELIFQESKGWHARAEDGSKIEKKTAGGEHWVVTTTDGTRYYFGLNRLPGQSSDTNSAWTVPVYGNHSGEPCHGDTFGKSACDQVWRWNLDYVVDVHGNTLSYWYAKETNFYAAEVTSDKKAGYVRGGHLLRADYGTWDRLTASGAVDRSVTPLAQVSFTPADRCTTDCGTHGANWPDTPWDQECTASAANCGTNYSPTFWSTKRLSGVTTRVWDTTKSPAGWQDVDSWTLRHSFPSPGDGENAGLWLDSITRTGHVGGTAQMPPVTFTPIPMRNRVLTQSNTTSNWQRLSAVQTETGALIKVTYSDRDCTSSSLPASPQNNTRLCYPVRGPDPLSTSGGDLTEWWHKYVVTQVTETDVQLADGHQAPTRNTYYLYVGSPAWHYADDDGLSKPKYKTWNQFRGYGTVVTEVGDSSKTLTETRYLRGMHGDRGQTQPVTVPASLGDETVYDEDQFAGMVREQVVYNGSTSRPVQKTVNVPWRSDPLASRTVNGDVAEARFVNTRVTYSATALGDHGSRGWRTTSSVTERDGLYGTVKWIQDNGDIAKTGDETCVSHTYNRNLTTNLTILPSQVTTRAQTCGATPSSADHIVSDARTFYDDATALDRPPTRGLPTRVEGLQSWTAAGGTVWQKTGTATFDAFGRPDRTTDIKNNYTDLDLSPAGGLVTKEVSNNSLSWATTTEKNPYWGLPTKTTDPNGRVTEVVYDPLGRVSKVWNTGWSRSAHSDKPSSQFSYFWSAERKTYPYVRTETLNAVGGYDVSIAIYDGFLRPRQNQSQVLAGERVVTDTLYDTHGRIEMTYGAHAEPGAPSGNLWWEPEWSVPTQNRNVYDQANRVTNSIFLSGYGETNIAERWRTTTAYEGDRTTVVPPDGGTTTTTIVDAQGRTVELRQGSASNTKYTYNGKGQLTKVADTAGNEWTYAYDVKGRRTEAVDPDRGRTTSAYNEFNEQTSTTDALGKTLQFTYDSLGRKTAVLEGSAKRAEWIYDKLWTTGGLVRGQLTETARYDAAGNAYRWRALGFTSRYQPTGAHYVIPANETGLAGTYTYGYGYAETNGAATSVTYPAGGNLASEQVTTVYDDTTALPVRLRTAWSGVDSYVSKQEYSSYGEPTVTTMMFTGGVYAQQAISYDTYTRRVDTVQVKPETAAGTVSQRRYDYDDAGNIIGVADTPAVGAADRQCFRQDELGQLTTAWTPSGAVDCSTATPSLAGLGGPAPYWIDWTYDKIGNRTKEVSHAAAGDTVRAYAVPPSGAGSVRPHSVAAMTTTLPGQTTGTTVSYGYDAIGNMTTRPGDDQSLTWDAEGHLARVTRGGTLVEENVYDADGNRIVRRDAGGQTLYLPGMEIRRNVSGSTATFAATRYYSFGGRAVASRTTGTQALTWLFSDHQGTQQIAVNAYSQAVTIRRQTPYGGTRGTPAQWPNNKGFVGGDNSPTGLVHLGAREYDPVLGRFISVDPLQDLADPRQWNAYGYANNSPITYSDPTGARPMIGNTGTDEGELLDENDEQWTIGDDGKFELTEDPDDDSGGNNGGQNTTAENGLSDEEVQRAQEIKKKNVIDVIVAAGGKILMEFFGITDILDCVTRGNLKACAMSLAGALPLGRAWKALETIPVIARAAGAILRWVDDIKWADDVLARVQYLGRRGADDSLLRTSSAGAKGSRLPMTMECVCQIAEKYGIDISDVKIKIDKGRDGYAGSTAPDQKVTLTRAAFRDEEQLARTLAHERYHVDQLRAGMGYPKTYDEGNVWESTAIAYENTWWDTVGRNLK